MCSVLMICVWAIVIVVASSAPIKRSLSDFFDDIRPTKARSKPSYSQQDWNLFNGIFNDARIYCHMTEWVEQFDERFDESAYFAEQLRHLTLQQAVRAYDRICASRSAIKSKQVAITLLQNRIDEVDREDLGVVLDKLQDAEHDPNAFEWLESCPKPDHELTEEIFEFLAENQPELLLSEISGRFLHILYKAGALRILSDPEFVENMLKRYQIRFPLLQYFKHCKLNADQFEKIFPLLTGSLLAGSLVDRELSADLVDFVRHTRYGVQHVFRLPYVREHIQRHAIDFLKEFLNDRPDICDLIAKHILDADIINTPGWPKAQTFLHQVLIRQHLECAITILSMPGVDLSFKDADDQVAFHYVGPDFALELFKRLSCDTIAALIQSGREHYFQKLYSPDRFVSAELQEKLGDFLWKAALARSAFESEPLKPFSLILFDLPVVSIHSKAIGHLLLNSLQQSNRLFKIRSVEVVKAFHSLGFRFPAFEFLIKVGIPADSLPLILDLLEDLSNVLYPAADRLSSDLVDFLVRLHRAGRQYVIEAVIRRREVAIHIQQHAAVFYHAVVECNSIWKFANKEVQPLNPNIVSTKIAYMFQEPCEMSLFEVALKRRDFDLIMAVLDVPYFDVDVKNDHYRDAYKRMMEARFPAHQLKNLMLARPEAFPDAFAGNPWTDSSKYRKVSHRAFRDATRS